METWCFSHGTADEGLSHAPGAPSSIPDPCQTAAPSTPVIAPQS